MNIRADQQTQSARRVTLPRFAILVLLLLLLAACTPMAIQPAAAPLVPTPGKITIVNAWARSVPVADGNSAAYLDILNGLESDVRLVQAQTSTAGVTELHETFNTNGVMSMQHQPDGWPIPAGGTLSLAPGGKHVMLMKLSAPLADGDTLSLALTFDNGTVEIITVPVRTQQ